MLTGVLPHGDMFPWDLLSLTTEASRVMAQILAGRTPPLIMTAAYVMSLPTWAEAEQALRSSDYRPPQHDDAVLVGREVRDAVEDDELAGSESSTFEDAAGADCSPHVSTPEAAGLLHGTDRPDENPSITQPDVWKFVGGRIKHPGCSS